MKTSAAKNGSVVELPAEKKRKTGRGAFASSKKADSAPCVRKTALAASELAPAAKKSAPKPISLSNATTGSKHAGSSQHVESPPHSPPPEAEPLDEGHKCANNEEESTPAHTPPPRISTADLAKQSVPAKMPKKGASAPPTASAPIASAPPAQALPKPPPFDPQAFAKISMTLSQINQRFHGNPPSGQIIGRATETQTLNIFFDSTVVLKRPGSLYICGKPGTGKSALVRTLCEKHKRKCRMVQLNGMTLTGGAKDLFSELLAQICPAALKEKMDPASSLRKIFTAPKSKSGRDEWYVVVIDEMDALLETGNLQTVLSTLFSWPKLPKSRLILIGIANALDLTHRFLPLLHRSGCAPIMLSFQAYSDQQLLEILRARIVDKNDTNKDEVILPATNNLPLISFEPSALELCARRISAESGDVRKAMEACRLAAKEALTQQSASAGGFSLVGVTVKIPVMMKIITSLFTPKTVQRLRHLPLHQNLVLCAIAIAANDGENVWNEDEILQKYLRVCRKHGLQALPKSEMNQLCSSLTDAGIMKMTREGRIKKLSLETKLEYVEMALEETPLFKHILLDTLRTSALAQV